MSYKTILVHADLSVHAPARTRAAAALANAENAHLIGAAMTGISRFVYPDSEIALASTVIGATVDALYAQAHGALAQFDALARADRVASFEQRLLSDDPEAALVQLARFADLVVLSQTDPGHPVAGVAGDLPEYVVLSCARPVLMLPYAGEHALPAANVLVAWDGGREATRAITNALPLLRRAAQVTVVYFESAAEAASTAAGASDSPGAHGAELTAWLARHAVNATFLPQRAAIDTGNALLSLAADLAAGLLVMGAYGHTRVRELLLGGVTKTVLRTMTLPVLMSH